MRKPITITLMCLISIIGNTWAAEDPLLDDVVLNTPVTSSFEVSFANVSLYEAEISNVFEATPNKIYKSAPINSVEDVARVTATQIDKLSYTPELGVFSHNTTEVVVSYGFRRVVIYGGVQNVTSGELDDVISRDFDSTLFGAAYYVSPKISGYVEAQVDDNASASQGDGFEEDKVLMGVRINL